MRLQSDMLLARDTRTACEWQSMVDNQQLMMSNFKNAMQKLAVTAHNPAKLIDCSEAVPVPVPAVKKPATFPAGTSRALVQQSCPLPFPALKVDPGTPTTIPECIDGDTNINDCPS